MHRLVLILSSTLLVADCSSTAPTPVPPTPDPPTISCPAPQTIQLSGASTSAIVTFTATATNGKAPVSVTCTPASGSSFTAGTTTVSCTATDALQRTAAPCTFPVTVLKPIPPPTLTVTRFVAFGDSITAGEDGTAGGPPTGGLCQPVVTTTATQQPRVILPTAQTYPGQLQAQLSARYTTQSPTMLNRGCPGEAVTGLTTRARFDAIVSTGQYDVVLIMEGSNDLEGAAADPATAAVALRHLVDDAKATGVRPFLATIPPMNPAGSRGSGAALVTMLNDRILQIGNAENLAIVDVYAAFNGNLALLGDDGLHPNANGYGVIAGAFFNTIKGALEVNAPSTLSFAPAVRRR